MITEINSKKDVERLKLIKMLRMLDMPLKEIERVVNGEVSVKEAVEHQREQLLSQKEQLQLRSKYAPVSRKRRMRSLM